MKDKGLMSSFFTANLIDTVTTLTAINSDWGFTEVGIMGAPVHEKSGIETAAIVKMGVIACMVGVYALTKTHEHRLAYSFEKALQVSHIIVWGVTALNIAQIYPYLIS